MIKAVIFDFDMTLVDSLKIGNRAIKDLERIYGISTKGLSEKEIWGMTHIGFAKKLAELNNNKLSWKEISELDIEYMKKHYKKCRLNNIDFLKKLQIKNIKLGIISNNSTAVIKDVLNNNKEVKFNIVFGNEWNINKSKTEIIEDCLELLKIESKELMYVGDHPNDIINAKKLGIISVGVCTGLHNYEELKEYDPDILIKNLDELREYIF